MRGSLLASAISAPVAASNCCGVASPERSSTCILNPPAWPMPCTGGGDSTSENASWIWLNCPMRWPEIAAADCCRLAARSSKLVQRQEHRRRVRLVGAGEQIEAR